MTDVHSKRNVLVQLDAGNVVEGCPQKVAQFLPAFSCLYLVLLCWHFDSVIGSTLPSKSICGLTLQIPRSNCSVFEQIVFIPLMVLWFAPGT
eukprot:SAG31_NODE_2379_length_5836_cov_4.527453_7_plen_92_part_00